MKHIYINGRFLGRSVTGVERFASMIIQNLDCALQQSPDSDRAWTILAPVGVARPSWWNGPFETVGTAQGHIWEQWDLARRARDGVLVNLCNAGPVSLRRSLTVIHDALPYDMPQNFRFAYRMLHRTLGHLIARRASIATVSQFSRERLAKNLHCNPETIAIIPNAAEHVSTITADNGIIEKLGLGHRPFLLFVGSFAPNKNLRTVLDAFARLDDADARLVLVGASGKSFAAHGFGETAANVILPGRIGDGELMALYRHARSLVFASTYEGFGIPPLEALQLGCPVIASDIPASREVCGDAAVYFPADDPVALARLMRAALDDPDLREARAGAAKARADLFSWAKSAAVLQACVEAIAADAADVVRR